ncbi:MAG: AsmA family protein [Magnetovibrionaceae bacterium]
MKKILAALGALVGILVVVVIIGVVVLSSMDFNQYKGLIQEEAKKATGRDLVLAGDLELSISLTPSINVSGVSFQNAAWGSRPEMAKLDELSAEVSLLPLLSQEIHVNRLVLRGLDVMAETDANGVGNWVFGEKKAEKEQEKHEGGGGPGVLPVVKLVSLRDVSVTYKDGVTGETLVAEIVELDLGADSASAPLDLRLLARYNGVDVEASGQLGSVEALLENDPFTVKLDAEAVGANVSLDGLIKDLRGGKGVDMGFSVSTTSIPETLKAASAMVPALAEVGPVPAVGIEVSGRAFDAEGGGGIKGLSLKLGSSDLGGDVSVRLDGPRPKVTADLSSTLLALDELMPADEGTKASEPASDSGDGRVFPADPLPLDGLKAADAAISLKAAKIQAKGNEVSDLSLQLALDGGKLQLSPFKATVSDGLVAGDISLNGAAATPSLSAKLDVKGLDYGKVLAGLQGGSAPVMGKVDLAADLKGAGGSVRALMAGLNGNLRVTSEGGKIDSKALNFASADLMAALPFVDSEGDKDIRCIVVDYRIASGMASSHATVIETGGFSVVGEGRINLADETLDLDVTPRAKKTNLASVAMYPIAIGGTLASPSFGPQGKALAKSALSIGAAVATGGLSLLAEKAVDVAKGAVDKTDYCALALAGKAVSPSGEVESESSSEQAAPSAEQEKAPAGKALEGAKDALKGLFGN